MAVCAGVLPPAEDGCTSGMGLIILLHVARVVSPEIYPVFPEISPKAIKWSVSLF